MPATQPRMPSGSSSRLVPLLPLSEGGMGKVDLVLLREGGFRRLYARKRLHPHHARDPEVRAMFLDEARIAGLIRHPNVVSVLDVGEDEDGPYLLMEYVEGVSAAEVIRRAGAEPVPFGACLEIARQAATGLDAAHRLRTEEGHLLGVVHRDVSPQNILLGFDGMVRLADFGIAKAFGQTTRTSTGVLKGKIGYMAPELLRFHRPDQHADIFSLGVVLYELLAGERLYREAEASETARRILEEPPPDVGELREEIGDDLVQLVFEMLAKDPGARPSSAAEVAQRLAGIQQSFEEGPADLPGLLDSLFGAQREELRGQIAAASAAAVELPTGAPGRRRAAFGAAAVTAALVLGGVAVVAFGGDPQGDAGDLRPLNRAPEGPSVTPERGDPTAEMVTGTRADDGAPELVEHARAAETAGTDAAVPDESQTDVDQATRDRDRARRSRARRRRARMRAAMETAGMETAGSSEMRPESGVELPLWGFE